jgi:DNA invertase Pin-like site-specific DNA recombinase
MRSQPDRHARPPREARRQRRRCAVYCRISQDRKHDQLGVARQERECRRIATARGWEVAAVFVDDDRSAFSAKPRKGYLDMVEAIKAGEIDAIVAWAPDRLTRHPRELEDLIDLLDAHRIEVATHLAGDYDLATSGGRITARVVGAVARHESEIKSERAQLKADEIARHGRFHGGQRPFGYAADGVTIIPEEAEAVRFMARRLTEGLGLRRIQAELNERGVPTVTGAPWRFSAVKQILTNPRIAGLRATRTVGPDGVRRYEVTGDAVWEPIVDRDTWEELQTILTDPRRKQARPARYLLTGLVVTAESDKMIGARAKGRPGAYDRRIYRGPGVSVDADQLEALIVEYVLEATDEAALPKARPVARVPSQVARLERELEQLAAERGRGDLSLREWQAARQPLLERLEAARRQAPPAERVPAGVTAVLGRRRALRQAWPDMTDDARRRALGVVLDRVVVHPIGPSGNRFDTDRIEPFLRH